MRSPVVVRASLWIALFALVARPGLPPVQAAEPEVEWKAGTAAVVITPDEMMWMAGYASRDKPAEGKVHDLNAKSLVLEDAAGARLAVVTLDLISIPRDVRNWLEAQVGRKYGLPPQALLVNASHTHCGPELRPNKVYLPTDRAEQCRAYLETLQQKLLEVVGKAIDDLSPVSLSYCHARAGFAMNRRTPMKNGFSNHPNPDGPVDHDVPVLRIDGPDGSLRAVVFGYACHATTLSGYEYCGDYPGFAQECIEQRHPGTAALFVAGCGGDQNPYPRSPDRALELCRQHGYGLANAVEAALQGPPKPVRGPLRAAIEQVTLDFAEPPSRETLETQIKSGNKYERLHAEFLLQQLEHEGKIPSTYPYLVQTVRFGDDLTIVALAGEVVVDYSLRLKSELAGSPLWVAGYSNDVFGYVPSVRVLREGGYEGGGAMLYTPLPGPFAPSVEERIVNAVHALLADAPTLQRN